MRHGKASKRHCPEPALTGDVQNMPPLRVPPGLDAPDTRNAIKIPPLPEPLVARSPGAPCLAAPPSFGTALTPYNGAGSARPKGQIDWYVNGGAAFTTGKAASLLNTGWTIGGGISYRRPQSRFSLLLDLSYADFNAAYKLVDLSQQKVLYSIDGGTGNVWSLTAKGKYTAPLTSRVSVYGLLGIGAYKESLKLTESALVGHVVCDWWGSCYPVATDGGTVSASRSVTNLGWNVGLGLEFPNRNGRSAWFAETGLHSVQGNNSIQYLPVQLGYRF
jgi:opacity protein-like surface antigen